MAAHVEASTAKILKEEPISAEEMEQQLRTFLSKHHVRSKLPKDDYTRLKNLQEALKLDTQETSTEVEQ